MFTLIPLSKDKHFAVTTAYSPRLFYSWTALWSIIHTKLILCWSPAAKRLRHRINYIIYTRMIIVYDSVKHWGIAPCVITTVVFGGQLFSLLSLISLMRLFPHCDVSLGLLRPFFFSTYWKRVWPPLWNESRHRLTRPRDINTQAKRSRRGKITLKLNTGLAQVGHRKYR